MASSCQEGARGARLSRFECGSPSRLAAQERIQERYAELIRACRLHFRGYRDYLLNREKYRSYAEYLTRNAAGVGG